MGDDTMRKSYILLPEGGYCYGVEAHSRNPFVELHGGFASYDAAYEHACELRAEFDDYTTIVVVKIETPAVRVEEVV